MTRLLVTGILLVVTTQIATAQERLLIAAASKYATAVVWQPNSIVTGDFTCRGRRERAILGSNDTDIVIAAFVNGVSRRPEILRYSAQARSASVAQLTVEDLDYDPLEVFGRPLPGFKRSTTCKGLNLSDGLVDSAHIYWDREAKRFHDWVR